MLRTTLSGRNTSLERVLAITLVVVGTGTNEINPKTGTSSVRFEVIGTVVNLTEPAAYCI